MENLGKSLQNLRLFGVFPMVRLIQALLVNVIKDIRQQKKGQSSRFLLICFLDQARNPSRAGLEGAFHEPGVHLGPAPTQNLPMET